ncbi:hypothetical protein BCEP4_1470008 [Burkholderia cepacia]|nr:hypothetical protein BCEP4_1470008 [Burkholderia cepacia]
MHPFSRPVGCASPDGGAGARSGQCCRGIPCVSCRFGVAIAVPAIVHRPVFVAAYALKNVEILRERESHERHQGICVSIRRIQSPVFAGRIRRACCISNRALDRS